MFGYGDYGLLYGLGHVQGGANAGPPTIPRADNTTIRADSTLYTADAA